MPMLKEFKEFAMRGNVLDMAVGIVIGAAFGGIVTSFVNDMLMPPSDCFWAGSISRTCSSTSRGATPAWRPPRLQERQRSITACS